MRALQRCDFCDADAVGTFEIVPPELDPTEAEQRRVVLCTDCSTRLETLLEPLLDRLATGKPTNTRAPKSPEPDPGTTQDTDSNPDEAIEIETEPIAIESSNDATTSDSADDSMTSESTADPDANESPATAGPEITESTATAESDTDESPAATGSDADESTATAATDEQNNAVAASDAGTAPDGEPSSDAGSASDQQQAVGPAEGRPRAPPAYNKVLRLLRNRREPMDRTALETLATSAYDLEHHEATAIVDHAIDNGDLLEDGGQLRPA